MGRRDPKPEQTTVGVLPRAGAQAPPRPYLLVLSGPQFGELFDLETGREVQIGRRPDAGIYLHDDGVSRQHASLLPEGPEALLRDLGSQNGTWVNGQRVEQARLRDGHRFHVGAHTAVKYVCSADPEAEVQRKLAQGALLEPVTGLYNRRHFLERLAGELAAAQRHNRALSLLLVDVDHFRRLNEEHGSAAGDEALRMLSRVVQGAVRKEDVVARFGGEELAVLARETGLSGARALAERIRKAVERSRCSFEGHELALTVSIGVTVSDGLTPFERGRTEAQMLEAADRGLSRAKQGGRNTVVALPAAGA
jgi:diguanylate cyclase (GGDEF)-like protein